MDFQTARLLGVRANRVIASAVLISGLLAATVAVMLTVQTPLVTPDFALRDTILVLAGVVLGGMNRLVSATLGGFAIGFASGYPRRRTADRSEPVPALVPVRRRHPRAADATRRIVHARGQSGGGARMRRALSLLEVVPPIALVLVAALIGTLVSTSTETYVITALVNVAIVVALYVFIGNSGRGLVRAHQLRRRRRVGCRRPVDARRGEAGDHAEPRGLPRRHAASGNVESLLIAAAVGAAYALIVGLPLMRLSGLAAGIATFGVLEITHNVLRYWETIGPGLNTFSAVPETTGLLQATVGAIIAVVVAFVYGRSRFGRDAARDAGGRGGCPRGRRVRLPPAADRLRTLRRRGGLRRRAVRPPAAR